MPSGKGARERRKQARLCLQRDWAETNGSTAQASFSTEASLNASHDAACVWDGAAHEGPAESGDASDGRVAARDSRDDAPAATGLCLADASAEQASTKVPQLNLDRLNEGVKAFRQWGQDSSLHRAQLTVGLDAHGMTEGTQAKDGAPTSADSRAETQREADVAAASQAEARCCTQQPGDPSALSQTNRSPGSEDSAHGVLSIPTLSHLQTCSTPFLFVLVLQLTGSCG